MERVAISPEDAKRFRRQFFRTWAGIRSWHDKCWRQAKDGVGIQRTVFGRLVQARAPKGAVEITDWTRFNMLTEYRVCGSAADLLKVSMVRMAERLPGDAHLVASVHDEIVVDCPANIAEDVFALAKREMTRAFAEMFGPDMPAASSRAGCALPGPKVRIHRSAAGRALHHPWPLGSGQGSARSQEAFSPEAMSPA